MPFITENEIRTSKNTVYIFGDNLKNRGLGGQAMIARPFVECGKTFGIPTKRSPTNELDAYFSDKTDELTAVRTALKHIMELHKEGKKIVFFPNIGKGYAQLHRRSPKIEELIDAFIAIMLKKRNVYIRSE